MEAPERPVEMGEETVEGAVAAAKYFMQLHPYINATGDFTEWDALVDQRCVNFCAAARSDADELHDAGGYSIGGDVEFLSESGDGPYDVDSLENAYVVDLSVRFAASEDVSGDGSRQSYEAGEVDFRVALIWSDGDWAVVDAWTPEAE
ncbi:DUF6318 family protein [Ruania alba]|uniref:DUF6318 family protein n=1 Tax=Ruania alba TaxID=648782 RepID=UPI000B7E6E93|nr:DUF6318 family protein [Ruania alba]